MSRHGSLRASDQDRDQVIDRLHKAATEGRIASEELEHRVSRALKARTYDELDATVADLPGPQGRPPARVGRSVSGSFGGWALAMVRANPILLLFAIPVLAVATAMLLAVTVIWTLMVVVFLILGGRRHMPRGPWTYAWHHSPRRYGPPRRGPRSRGGPGRDWA